MSILEPYAIELIPFVAGRTRGARAGGTGGPSGHARLQRCLHGGWGLKGSEHVDGADRSKREFGRDVRLDDDEAEDLDRERLSGFDDSFQLGAGVAADAEVELPALDGLADGLTVSRELIADGGPDEIGPVRIEPFGNEKVDLAEVDRPEIDGDLLAFGSSTGAARCRFMCHVTIRVDGIWMSDTVRQAPEARFRKSPGRPGVSGEGRMNAETATRPCIVV